MGEVEEEEKEKREKTASVDGNGLCLRLGNSEEVRPEKPRYAGAPQGAVRTAFSSIPNAFAWRF